MPEPPQPVDDGFFEREARMVACHNQIHAHMITRGPGLMRGPISADYRFVAAADDLIQLEIMLNRFKRWWPS